MAVHWIVCNRCQSAGKHRRLQLNQFISTGTSTSNQRHPRVTRKPPLSLLKKSLILLNNENKSLFRVKLQSTKPVASSQKNKTIADQLCGKFECLSENGKRLSLNKFITFLQLNLFVCSDTIQGKCDCICHSECNAGAIKLRRVR